MNDTKPPFTMSKEKNDYKDYKGHYLVIHFKGGGSTSAGRVSEVKGNKITLNPYRGIRGNRDKGWLVLQMIAQDSSFYTPDIQRIEESTRRDLLDWCYIHNMDNPKIKESELVKKSDN
ncbi:MAG: hypothetical protein AABW47_01675 [Nanoarchaeota archaeon]